MTCYQILKARTKCVPIGDYLDEAGQSCARALFKRPLGATRVWSWRVLGSRWRRHAGPSEHAHCRGRVRRRRAKLPSGNHIGLGVNPFSPPGHVDSSSDPSMPVGAVGRPPGAPPGPPGSARWLPGTAQVCFSSYRPKFGARPFVLRCLRAEPARPCIMRMAHSHPENHDASLSAAAAHLALASVS